MKWLFGLLCCFVAAVQAEFVLDPMAPPAAFMQQKQKAVADMASLRLQQVVRGKAPRAAINGRWLKIGDQLGQWQLRQVDARSVLLDDGSSTLRLTLFERGQLAEHGD